MLPILLLLIPAALGQVDELITFCEEYEACVDYLLCGEDNVIIDDGGGLIDKRLGNGLEECNLLNGICCRIPGSPGGSAPQTQCHPSYACVEFESCNDEGKISTDGAGLIMKRTGLISTCDLPHGGGQGLCCLKPGFIHPTLDNCFVGDSCTAELNCKVPYTHEEGQRQPCFKNDGDVGICCIEEHIEQPVTQEPIIGCGYNNSQVSTRITNPHGDNDAFFGEFPWQAIIFNQNYTFQCGAIIISRRFLLTAAHCVENFFGNPGAVQIRVGDYQVDKFSESLPYEDHPVKEIYIHEKYNTRNNRNGIALIELAQPLVMKYHINSICLPSDPYSIYGPLDNFEISYDHNCYATGWGQDAFNGKYQARMKKVRLPILQHNHCQDLLRKNTRLSRWFRLDQGFLCAGGPAERDACKGDGGGPLSCWNPTTFRYEVVGITSWGMDCGKYGVPGVYMNVFNYLPWIESTIKKAGQYDSERFLDYGK